MEELEDTLVVGAQVWALLEAGGARAARRSSSGGALSPLLVGAESGERTWVRCEVMGRYASTTVLSAPRGRPIPPCEHCRERVRAVEWSSAASEGRM